MNLFIIGQKWFGSQVLQLARDLGHDVAGVYVPGPRREDRLCHAAMRACVPVLSVGGAGRLEAGHLPAGLDLIVAAHAHVYLSSPVLAAARLGAVGYHPSLLPRHRGRDAVRWTIYMGDAIAGGTVFRVEERVDAGAALAQDWCFVRPDDTPTSLWKRDLAPMGLRLLRGVLGDPKVSIAAAKPQDESAATWEPAFDRTGLAGTRVTRE